MSICTNSFRFLNSLPWSSQEPYVSMFFGSWELYLKSLATTLLKIPLNKWQNTSSHCRLRVMNTLKVLVGRRRFSALNSGLSSQKVGNLWLRLSGRFCWCAYIYVLESDCEFSSHRCSCSGLISVVHKVLRYEAHCIHMSKKNKNHVIS